jgi:3-dehydroquinate synthetase
MWTLGNLHLDRQSFVIALGGGSVLDMIGFAVSIVHRGLRLVRLPTTTLAQSDAGVGVKTGMDEHGQKNFVGTFAPPFAVINDFELLKTLSFEHWIGGVDEALAVQVQVAEGPHHVADDVPVGLGGGPAGDGLRRPGPWTSGTGRPTGSRCSPATA